MPRKKQLLIGNGMNANLLKEFIDLSYKGNTSIAPEGYDIDAPLSDSRVKVYAKKGSNDKNIVVTHRGSVGLDDWMDNASYLFRGKVKGTKTYNLHRERHKKAVEKYGAKNIIAIGHSRAGLYLQELQKEFPIKENITYNKASGFHDIGRQNDPNQTDVRVGNDVVSLLAPLQKHPNQTVNISGTKNPLDFNTAHQSSEIDKLGTTFIGKKEEEDEAPKLTGLKPIVALRPDKPKPNPTAMLNYGKNNLTKLEGSGNKPILKPKTLDQLKKELIKYEKQLAKIEKGKTYKTLTRESVTDLIVLTKERIDSYEKKGEDIDREKRADYSSDIPKKLTAKDRKALAFILKPITQEIAVEDYKKLEKQKNKIPPMSSNDGNKFVDYFTFVERLNTKTKSGYTFYEFWENKDEEAKKKYFQNLFKANSNTRLYETNLYDIFRLYFGSVNIFKPVIAMEIYNKFKPTSVLDPTMGWGGRLMGATILDVPKYTGVDLNPNLEQPYADMVEQIKKIGTKTKIKLFIPQDSLTIDYSKLDYDMVFTSPPYYNVEIYTGTKRVNKTKGSTIKKEWNENFYKPLFTKTWEHLKLGGHFVINVPKPVYDDVLLPLLGECDSKIPLRLSARKSKAYIEGKKEKTYSEFIYVWKKTDLKPLFYGEGIVPRVSSVKRLNKMLGVEMRRLMKIDDENFEYKSPYMTKQKLEEKVSRLNERLNSAKANDGHAEEKFFIPKTEKWLKINRNDTFLNTPLKEEGKHSIMLAEIDRLLAELRAKRLEKTNERKQAKLAKKLAKVEGLIDKNKLVIPKSKMEEIKSKLASLKDASPIITEEINKAKVAFEIKQEEVKEEIKNIEAPKPKQTKEEIKQQKLLIKAEKKKAKLEKKKEYDRLRYLEIKANKLKKVKDTSPKVEVFKEEVEDFVDDLEIDQEDLARQLAEMDIVMEDDEVEEEEEVTKVAKAKAFFKESKSNIKDELTKRYAKKALEIIEAYEDIEPNKDLYLKSRSLRLATEFGNNLAIKKILEVAPLLIEEVEKRDVTIDNEEFIDSKILSARGKSRFDVDSWINMVAVYNEVKKEVTKDLKATGSGFNFNKKQLTKIILDKNKVIADLEEKAYGSGIYTPTPYEYSYLDNILDNNTTRQNLTIHREHFNSVPKYISSIV
jgi:hypothetical protein